ncbi:MAG TPA: tetratricopeptide repeat protein [Mucilaginibacter sp.]|jgi:tetratricopeptide (TPR) repeat protein
MSNFVIPKIFLSYAWANADVVDEIDNDFKTIGIKLTRDVRDLGYRKSIKEFMYSIDEHDFVLMLISDEYLRSENCMYEVTELLGTHHFKERILPIVHDNASQIFKLMERAVYYDYWKTKHQQAKEFNRKYANQDSVDAVRKFASIYNYMDVFFTRLTDLNVLSLPYLKKQNYLPLLDIVGISELNNQPPPVVPPPVITERAESTDSIESEAVSISQIENEEERLNAIDKFLAVNQGKAYNIYYKAWFAGNSKEYAKAKIYYTQFLKDSNNGETKLQSYAHNNLANLLKEQFADNNGAKFHYEEALRIDPQFALSHNGLAFLLTDKFADHNGAKYHYEEAIRINPQYSLAHYNLAALLTDRFADHNGAKYHYEESLRLNPQYALAHNNLAVLLTNKFADHNGAKHHYEEAIRLDPYLALAEYNLAALLTNQFADQKGSKLHYEKSLSINPNYAVAHNNLAVLLTDKFGDHAGARLHYEEAIRLDPQLAIARDNLAKLPKK